jgi:hypothetical protein
MPSVRQILSPGKRFVRPGPTSIIGVFVNPTAGFEYSNETFVQQE